MLILNQLFENTLDYIASDEWLYFKLFADKAESLCLIWKYTNMMILDCGGEYYQKQTPTENKIFINLSDFYKVNGTFSVTEEKNIIGLFRKMIQMDNYFK